VSTIQYGIWDTILTCVLNRFVILLFCNQHIQLVDMLQLLRYFTFTTACMCFLSTSIFAHGPAHERIATLSKKIKKNPQNYSLYIDRAGFYKIDGNFDKSFADYQTAKTLNSDIPNLDYMLSELFYEFEYYNSALSTISSYQKLNINTAECYLMKAKIFDKLFMADSALYYAEAAYPHNAKPSTNYFVTVKEYVLFADKTNYKQAKHWMEEGKRRLPYDLVIQEEYVKLALKFQDFTTAEALCLEKIPTLKRKEYWQYLLADTYLRQGDEEKAIVQLNAARTSIDKLPRHHRSTSYIAKLDADIISKIKQIKS